MKFWQALDYTDELWFGYNLESEQIKEDVIYWKFQ